MTGPHFPGILGEIAAAAGVEVAAQIRDAFGGTRVTLPGFRVLSTPQGANTKLVRLIGIDAARRIAEKIVPACGYYVSIPRGVDTSAGQQAEVIFLSLRGLSVQQIARQLRLTERTVYRIRRKYDLTQKRTEQRHLESDCCA